MHSLVQLIFSLFLHSSPFLTDTVNKVSLRFLWDPQLLYESKLQVWFSSSLAVEGKLFGFLCMAEVNTSPL